MGYDRRYIFIVSIINTDVFGEREYSIQRESAFLNVAVMNSCERGRCMKLRRFLVPVDGSESAGRALGYAIEWGGGGRILPAPAYESRKLSKEFI